VTLILASGSPQRRAILRALDLAFEVRPADVAEDEAGPAVDVARGNALRKALGVERAHDDVVLGVDTVVATETELWGKPADAAAARRTLRSLSGRTHEVISGFALVGAGGVRAGHDTTLVTFRELTDAVIDWYVASGEWEGRAGGYAIQGRGGALIRRIEGDYLNVVGLPVAALLEAGLPGFA